MPVQLSLAASNGPELNRAGAASPTAPHTRHCPSHPAPPLIRWRAHHCKTNTTNSEQVHSTLDVRGRTLFMRPCPGSMQTHALPATAPLPCSSADGLGQRVRLPSRCWRWLLGVLGVCRRASIVEDSAQVSAATARQETPQAGCSS